jgi:hypothetical protein
MTAKSDAPDLGLLPDIKAFPVRFLSTIIVGVVLLIWVVAFALTGFFTSAKSPWAVALGITTGTKDPFDSAPGARGVAAFLAVWSWLLVPVGIGAVVALILGDLIRGGTLAEAPDGMSAQPAEQTCRYEPRTEGPGTKPALEQKAAEQGLVNGQ